MYMYTITFTCYIYTLICRVRALYLIYISCLPKGGPSDKAVGADSLKSGESGDSLPMPRPELHAQEVMKYISPH